MGPASHADSNNFHHHYLSLAKKNIKNNPQSLGKTPRPFSHTQGSPHQRSCCHSPLASPSPSDFHCGYLQWHPFLSCPYSPDILDRQYSFNLFNRIHAHHPWRDRKSTRLNS